MAKILVVGARGNVGSKLVPMLLEKKEKVKGATSDKKITAASGAETVYLDLGNPATYPEALDGVDRLYMMSPTGRLDLVDSLKAFISAAASRRIKIVFHTAMGVDSDDSIPLRQVEIQLEKSGTRFVILRPNWFMDNFHNYWRDSIKRDGLISVPAADSRTSFIDTLDIAASAAAVLRTDDFDGRAFSLTGPRALTYGEAAVIISRVTGKVVHYNPVSGEELVQTMVKAGVAEEYAKFLAGIFVPVVMGYSAAVTDSVKEITGKNPRTMEEYTAEHAALWL